MRKTKDDFKKMVDDLWELNKRYGKRSLDVFTERIDSFTEEIVRLNDILLEVKNGKSKRCGKGSFLTQLIAAYRTILSSNTSQKMTPFSSSRSCLCQRIMHRASFCVGSFARCRRERLVPQ